MGFWASGVSVLSQKMCEVRDIDGEANGQGPVKLHRTLDRSMVFKDSDSLVVPQNPRAI